MKKRIRDLIDGLLEYSVFAPLPFVVYGVKLVVKVIREKVRR